jgi:colanic acid biosynthesis glycosyl transferase WcaI
LNLLILSQYFWPENFRINDVAQGLASRGHTVTVLTGLPNYPGGKLFRGYGLFGPYKELLNGVVIRRTPLISRGPASNVRLALNYLSHAVSTCVLGPFLIPEHIDGILVFEPSPITIGIPARLIRRIKHAPVAFWVQDLWPQSLSATGAVRSKGLLHAVDLLTQWIYRGCDRVLVQSEAFIEHVAAQGVPKELIEYLPNSAEAFYRPQPSSPVRREFGNRPRLADPDQCGRDSAESSRNSLDSDR